VAVGVGVGRIGARALGALTAVGAVRAEGAVVVGPVAVHVQPHAAGAAIVAHAVVGLGHRGARLAGDEAELAEAGVAAQRRPEDDLLGVAQAVVVGVRVPRVRLPGLV